MSRAGRDDRPQVLLAIVADGHEMTLRALTSILNVQAMLMTRGDGPGTFTVEMAVFRTVNDSLDALHRDPRFEAALIVRSNVGFDPAFVTRAFDSRKPLVLGVAPLPMIDWDRVVREIVAGTPEPPEFTGNVYGVRTEGPVVDGYARAAAVTDASVMFVRRSVVDGIVSRHPEVRAEKSAFALDVVRRNKYVPGLQNFVELHGGDVWADVDSAVVVAAPLMFAGSVGGRAILR